MDGNGRWAESRGLLRIEGHRAGMETVKTVVQSCLEKGIGILSLFAFSSENWLRPEDEVAFLMQLFIQVLKSEVNALHEHGVSLRFIGDRAPLSPELVKQMRYAEQITEHNTKLRLNIAVNYSGKWDILQAAKSMALDFKAGDVGEDELTEYFFASKLTTSMISEPDLLIRTSGEQRISNFFLWQLAYTELFFSKAKWPDFSAVEFESALASYAARERRYGKVSRQIKGQTHV